MRSAEPMIAPSSRWADVALAVALLASLVMLGPALAHAFELPNKIGLPARSVLHRPADLSRLVQLRRRPSDPGGRAGICRLAHASAGRGREASRGDPAMCRRSADPVLGLHLSRQR